MLERLLGLPLRVERVDVEGLERRRGRGTTVVRLSGRDRTGLGEDVTFQPEDRLAEPPALPEVASLGELSSALDTLDLFTRAPQHDVVRSYRRWAVESAALDLALAQAGLTLGEALGLEPRALRFVVSSSPYPGAQLKLDAASLPETSPLRGLEIVDFKLEGDRELVERVCELYPDALLEDPPVVLPGARVSWDIPIRSAADVPAGAAAINVKPARLGGLRALFGLYELGVPLYGGGQDELGPGRLHAQRFAALFHPDAPNDLAPVAYNEPQRPLGLPRSPLEVA